MRPLIGVTTSELRRGNPATLQRHSEPIHPEMALGMTYLRAIDRAAGCPWCSRRWASTRWTS